MNTNNTTSSISNKTFGEIFVAYTKTIKPKAHRDPLRANLIGINNEELYGEVDALILINWISRRREDNLIYTLETNLENEIPKVVTIRVNCGNYFWWHGRDPINFLDTYDEEKGYFDCPYESPFGTDFSQGVHLYELRDHNTGEILKDENGRNLAAHGYLCFHYLKDEAIKLFEAGKTFDWLTDGERGYKLGHCGPKGCLKQNTKTGKWHAAW